MRPTPWAASLRPRCYRRASGPSQPAARLCCSPLRGRHDVGTVSLGWPFCWARHSSPGETGRKGVTGTHYNFALYEKQVRKALQTWADHVEVIAQDEGAGQGNVVQLAGPAGR